MALKSEPKFQYSVPGINNLGNSAKQYIDFYSTTHEYGVAFLAFLTRLNLGWGVGIKEYGGYGTNNPAYTRQNGVSRKIDLGFQVPSDSPSNARYNLQKLGFLAKLIYPRYEQSVEKVVFEGVEHEYAGNTYASDSEFEITFGNLVSGDYTNNSSADASADDNGVLCVIKDLSFQIDLESGFVVNENKDPDSFYPKLINVSLELVIINQGETFGWYKQGGKSVEAESFKGFPFGVATDKARDRILYTRSMTFETPAAFAGLAPAPETEKVDPNTDTVNGEPWDVFAAKTIATLEGAPITDD